MVGNGKVRKQPKRQWKGHQKFLSSIENIQYEEKHEYEGSHGQRPLPRRRKEGITAKSPEGSELRDDLG